MVIGAAGDVKAICTHISADSASIDLIHLDGARSEAVCVNNNGIIIINEGRFTHNAMEVYW